MTRRHFTSMLGFWRDQTTRRVLAGIFTAVVLVLGALTVSGHGEPASPRPRPAAAYPKPAPQFGGATQKINAMMDEGRPLSATFSGTARAQRALQQGQVKPLSMATADFDGDGVADLIVGYSSATGGAISLHRGNIDAFAPSSHDSWLAIGANHFPSPFLPAAQAIDTPVAPDFLAAGDFNGDSYPDIVVAAKGSHALYLLAGDGHGNFAAPQSIPLSGTLTALADGHIGVAQSSLDLAVSITTAEGAQLVIYAAQNGSIASL